MQHDTLTFTPPLEILLTVIANIRARDRDAYDKCTCY